MSDDIIERLRSAECYDYGSSSVVVGWLKNDPIDEAVEEIERLRERLHLVNELRLALAALVSLTERLIDTRRCAARDLRVLNAARAALQDGKP